MINSKMKMASRWMKRHAFSGVRKYVENNDIAGLMKELDNVDTETKEAIFNKLSISDGNGGRIRTRSKSDDTNA